MIKQVMANNRPLVALLFGILFIGFTAIFTRLTLCSPITAGFWRSALALPILFFMTMLPSNRTQFKKMSFFHMCILTLLGMIFGINIAVWNAALNYTSIANVGFLSNTMPIFILLAAWVFSWHPLTINTWLALALAILGVGLMSFGSQTPEINWYGDSLAILSALIFAIYIVFVTRLRQKINLWIILFFSDFGACLILGSSSLFLKESLAIHDINTLLWLLALSLFSQVLGQGLITTALKYFSPTFSGLALTLTPVVCVIAAWFVFEESLSFLQISGILFIMTGIYLSKQKNFTGDMIKIRTIRKLEN